MIPQPKTKKSYQWILYVIVTALIVSVFVHVHLAWHLNQQSTAVDKKYNNAFHGMRNTLISSSSTSSSTSSSANSGVMTGMGRIKGLDHQQFISIRRIDHISNSVSSVGNNHLLVIEQNETPSAASRKTSTVTTTPWKHIHYDKSDTTKKNKGYSNHAVIVPPNNRQYIDKVMREAIASSASSSSYTSMNETTATDPSSIVLCNCTDPGCIHPFLCSRGIIQIHKMGVTLTSFIRKQYLLSIRACELLDHNSLNTNFETYFRYPHSDYRHIIVTRNFYDAIISGYLYHKKHMECELDWFGKPGFEGWLLNNKLENWEERIQSSSTYEKWPWPPGNGRDICTYLSDESETDGLRVYTEWAKHIYLDPLVSFVQSRHQMEKQNGIWKTWHLCYEQILDQYVTSVQQMAKLLIVGPLMRPVIPSGPGIVHQDVGSKSSMNHSTSKDPELIARLKVIIQHMDDQIYNHSIAQGNEMFGCSHKVKKKTVVTEEQQTTVK